MKYLFSTLIALSYCLSFSQNYSHKYINYLKINQIDSIFYAANTNLKTKFLASSLDTLFKDLNGTIIIIRHDTILASMSKGVLKFYEDPDLYSSWDKKTKYTAKQKETNKININTHFEIASISKQFTAAAILKLVSESKLKLTDSLSFFFDNIPYSNVTIHNLLSHTSGIPDYVDFPASWFGDTSVMSSNSMLIEIFNKNRPPCTFLPSQNFEYSNSNYAILASIVETVTEMPFNNYVKKNLFKPAEMKETFFVNDDTFKAQNNIATGHLKNKREMPNFYQNGILGDKGIYTTVYDLIKWKNAYLVQKKIIPAYLLSKATQKENFLTGKDKVQEIYGYGYRIENNPNYGTLIYHGGLWRGFQNVMVYREKDDLLIIFFSNYRNGAHLGKSNEVLHILDGI